MFHSVRAIPQVPGSCSISFLICVTRSSCCSQVRQKDGGDCFRKIDVRLVDERADERAVARFAGAIAQPWPVTGAIDSGALESAPFSAALVGLDRRVGERFPWRPGEPSGQVRHWMRMLVSSEPPRSVRFRLPSPATSAADPFLPRKLAQMSRGTDGDETDRHPSAAARRGINALGAQIEPAHLAGARVAIPARKPESGRVEIARSVAASDRSASRGSRPARRSGRLSATRRDAARSARIPRGPGRASSRAPGPSA